MQVAIVSFNIVF